MSPLVSPDDWGDFTSSPAPDNVDSLLGAASAEIRRYCGWSISLEVVEDLEVDTFGGPMLFLQTMRLNSIESLFLNGVEMVDSTDFSWSRRGVIRRLPVGVCWPKEFRSVVASYTHGYTNVPEEIQALCVGLVRRSWVSLPGIKQKQVGGISLTFADSGGSSGIALDEYEKCVLDSYALESGR